MYNLIGVIWPTCRNIVCPVCRKVVFLIKHVLPEAGPQEHENGDVYQLSLSTEMLMRWKQLSDLQHLVLGKSAPLQHEMVYLFRGLLTEVR